MLNNKDLKEAHSVFTSGQKSLRQIAKEMGMCKRQLKEYFKKNNMTSSMKEEKKKKKEEKPKIKFEQTQSRYEKDIVEYISKYAGEVEVGNKDILKGMEIDIVDHKNKLAFEYNGLFYHSRSSELGDKRKSMSYHDDKTKTALKKGYKLFHIWEGDNKNLIKNHIDRIYGKSKEVFLEALDFEISISVGDFFKGNHHFSGIDNDVFFYLRDDHDIFLVMGADLKNSSLVINRIAFYQDFHIDGGLEFLISSIIKYRDSDQKEFREIMLEIESDWFPDPKEIEDIHPSLRYIGTTGHSAFFTDEKKRFHKTEFSKDKVLEKFEDFTGMTSINKFLEEKGIVTVFAPGIHKFFID